LRGSQRRLDAGKHQHWAEGLKSGDRLVRLVPGLGFHRAGALIGGGDLGLEILPRRVPHVGPALPLAPLTPLLDLEVGGGFCDLAATVQPLNRAGALLQGVGSVLLHLRVENGSDAEPARLEPLDTVVFNEVWLAEFSPISSLH
jgi:hypothetical protein